MYMWKDKGALRSATQVKIGKPVCYCFDRERYIRIRVKLKRGCGHVGTDAQVRKLGKLVFQRPAGR